MGERAAGVIPVLVEMKATIEFSWALPQDDSRISWFGNLGLFFQCYVFGT